MIPIHAIELEPRVLYSASPIEIDGTGGLVDAYDVGESTTEFFAQPEIHSDWDSTNWGNPSLETKANPDDLLIAPVGEFTSTPVELAQELVFVDSNVENWQQLLDDLSLSADGDRILDVVLLDSDRDGIVQISEKLANLDDVAAIHFVSHGNETQLNLGATTLTNQNLSAYAGEIANWRDSLAEGADLLIYGCDLASSDSGRELIEGLAALCDCDLAASKDLTGHISLGGDWDLEYHVGLVETETAFNSEVHSEWIGSLAAFTVTTTADNFSVGTLRWAIDQANTNGGLDTINFNIPDSDAGHLYYRDDGIAGSLSVIATTSLSDASILDFDPDYPYAGHSWFQIDLDNSLAQLTITDAVIIDGYSQPGASENTLAIGHDANIRIELTNSAADSKRGLTFDTGSNSSVLKGLAINEFGGLGVLANYDVHNITIQGNYVGTDITGTLDRGNGDAGIQIRSNDNLIGGSNAADRNIISGSNNRGIAFFTVGSLTGNIIENNYIGVDATGVTGLGNNSFGIQLYATDGAQVLNNVVADNANDGIRFLAGNNVDNSIIQGNLIGVGADGATLIGNGGDGIGIVSNSAAGSVIGGTGAGEGNVIANNGGNGILLDGAAVSGTTIMGNFIGTDAAGLLDLGNAGYGVLIENGSFGNTIGGTTPGSGNKIAFNQLDGVALKSDSGNGNAILGNSIFDNGGLGIDLNDDDETDNDNFDSDGGSNTRINYPVLTSAITDGSTSIAVSGWFNTTPGVATYRLEFFTSPTADPGGNGEGQTLIGTVDVVTSVDGVAVFNQTFAATVGIGEVVSATATDSTQNTSEFSLAITAGTDTSTNNGLWMSTEDNVSASGAPGLGDWTDGEVISFGGPSLELEPASTNGNFASVFNLDQLGDGDVDIDGIHYVTQDTVVGIGANSIDLLAGDVLFSTANNETFFGGTMTVDEADLFLYRPNVAGDYSIGTMTMVLDMDSPPISDPDLSFSDMWSVTLVEQDVTIGGYDLFSGEILFTRSGGSDHQDVYVFHVTDTGLGATDGTADKLIEGTALGFSQKIDGLDIVERSIDVGDETLAQATLLISLDSDTDVLDADADPLNDLSVTRYDIISFDIARTELTGGTAANGAKLIFEGADVNIDNTDENIDAFTIVNAAPANVAATDIFPDSATVDEFVDTTLGYSVTTLTNNDPDSGDTFTYTIVGGVDATRFTIGGIGDELILTDGILDYETKGSYTVDVQVEDSVGNTFVDTITVSVNDLNDAPVITSNGGGTTALVNVAENTTAVTTVTSSDPDLDTPIYLITGGADATLFNIDAGTGALTFTSGRDFETPTDSDLDGAYEVEITVSDGNGGTDVQTIVATILDANEAPTTSGVPDLAVDEDSIDQSLDLQSAFADPEDADSDLVYTIENVTNPGLFDSVTINPLDRIVMDFTDDQNGFTFITVRATDTAGLFVETTFRVDVNPINDDPFVAAAIPPVVVNEDAIDTVIDLSTVFDDVDILTNSDVLTYSLVSNTNTGLVAATVLGNNSTLDYVDHQFGVATITVRATDTFGRSITETINVTVNPVNDAPLIGTNELLIVEGASVILSGSELAATDIDNADPSLVFSVSNVLGGQFELAGASGTAMGSFTQAQITAGDVVFVDNGDELAPSYDVEVSDGSLTNGPQAAAITFVNVNDAPIGNDDSFSFGPDDTISGSGLLDNDTDVDDAVLTASLNTAPTDGTVTVNNDGSFIYIPGLTFTGTDSFTYVVNDGETDSAPTTVLVSVITFPPPPATPISPVATTADSDEDDSDPLSGAVPANVSASIKQLDGIVQHKSVPLIQAVYEQGELVLKKRTEIEVAMDQNPDLYWLGAGFERKSGSDNSLIAGALSSLDPSFLNRSGWFWQALEQNRMQLESEASLPEILLGSTAAITSSVTVGYLIWLIKGGQVMAALMANLPAWRLIDPLPILNAIIDEEDGDDDSLQSMIAHGDATLESGHPV